MIELIREIEVTNVAELKAAIAELPDEMEVSDSVGELLCLRVFERGEEQFMEVA